MLKRNTYRTLTGVKEVVELSKKEYHQWIVYLDDKPKFFVDFYDLEKESNAMMNSLVLCTKSSMEEVLKKINEKHLINLSLPKVSRIGFQKLMKSEDIELNLELIPEKWLGYSL